MTPTAAVITSLVVLAVVWGVLNRCFKAVRGRKTIVVPDDQVLPRMIRLRSHRTRRRTKGEA